MVDSLAAFEQIRCIDSACLRSAEGSSHAHVAPLAPPDRLDPGSRIVSAALGISVEKRVCRCIVSLPRKPGKGADRGEEQQELELLARQSLPECERARHLR